MVGLGRAGLATGPGSGLTPGIAGDRSVVKLTPVENACADGAGPERSPAVAALAVAALAVAAQENSTKAPTSTPISTFRGLCSFQYVIFELPFTFSDGPSIAIRNGPRQLYVLVTTITVKVAQRRRAKPEEGRPLPDYRAAGDLSGRPRFDLLAGLDRERRCHLW
jgi:hypothetical protein